MDDSFSNILNRLLHVDFDEEADQAFREILNGWSDENLLHLAALLSLAKKSVSASDALKLISNWNGFDRDIFLGLVINLLVDVRRASQNVELFSSRAARLNYEVVENNKKRAISGIKKNEKSNQIRRDIYEWLRTNDINGRTREALATDIFRNWPIEFSTADIYVKQWRRVKRSSEDFLHKIFHVEYLSDQNLINERFCAAKNLNPETAKELIAAWEKQPCKLCKPITESNGFLSV